MQIQEHETPYLVGLVHQAQANLAPHSRIVKLVIDRAYVDGPSLHALHEMGITFVVIAKSNMLVRDVALAEQAGTPIYERSETVRRGHGREAYTEVWVSRVRVVPNLRQWDNFRPAAEEGQRLNWEQRPLLQAVIVNLWRNRAPAPDDENCQIAVVGDHAFGDCVIDVCWALAAPRRSRFWLRLGFQRREFGDKSLASSCSWYTR